MSPGLGSSCVAKDLLVVLHHVFEGTHGLFAANEERHDHMRKDHDIPEREDGEKVAVGKL
jgi:hypothetical protein